MRTASVLLFTFMHLLIVSLQCNAFPHQPHHPNHPFGPEKVTNLKFFLHNTLSGKDPSAVLVAKGPNTPPMHGGAYPFSSMYVLDDVLTEGPEKQSKVFGNAQGMYISTGQHELSIVMGIDFEITAGPFSGSSFVVYSRNPITVPEGREVAIIGGRGVFRMARGFAMLRTQHLDTSTGDRVIEFDVTLVHH